MVSEAIGKMLNETPFPNGLKTHELRVGMIVRNGKHSTGFVFTILEEPGETWVKVLRHATEPWETNISLADFGCQPYKNGKWNPVNWLVEVV